MQLQRSSTELRRTPEYATTTPATSFRTRARHAANTGLAPPPVRVAHSEWWLCVLATPVDMVKATDFVSM